MSTRYTKWLSNIPNGHLMYQHFTFQGPPKYTQIWIFGWKTYHLATLWEECLSVRLCIASVAVRSLSPSVISCPCVPAVVVFYSPWSFFPDKRQFPSLDNVIAESGHKFKMQMAKRQWNGLKWSPPSHLVQVNRDGSKDIIFTVWNSI
jgi:hypothetical protein